MRALLRPRYGGADVLRIGDHAPPSFRADEVLVRVHATSLNAADWFMLTGTPWPLRLMTGLVTPSSPLFGLDVAGVVEEVGAEVAGIRVGDAVFGEARGGAFAELAVLRASRLAKKPAALSFEQAATLPVAGCTALQGMRDKARVKRGDRVLIHGASGGVGTFAVQVARALGGEVTAVCSARNAETARRLGAMEVIDYAERDFTETERRFDVVFDLVGTTPLQRCLRLLRPGGRFVSSAGRIGRVLRVAIAALWPGSPVVLLAAGATTADLEALASMAERGEIEPAITDRYAFDDLPEALRRQGEGHARGKSVVSVRQPEGVGVEHQPLA